VIGDSSHYRLLDLGTVSRFLHSLIHSFLDDFFHSCSHKSIVKPFFFGLPHRFSCSPLRCLCADAELELRIRVATLR
jgi:hypothetical protein